MNQIQALIIDDEMDSCEILTEKIKLFCPNITVVGIANNVREAEIRICSLKPQLLFLDVEMPGQSGFDLLRKIGNNIDFDVIFVTAYNQYAIRAIECSALGFVLKPIQNEKLVAAVNTVANKRIHKENYENLLSLLSKGQREAKLAIPTEKGLEFIKIMDIIYLEADGKYTIFHTIKGIKRVSAYGLSYYTSLLSDAFFFQTHRSFIINLSYVLKYEKSGKVFLENNVKIPLARSKKNEFLLRMKP